MNPDKTNMMHCTSILFQLPSEIIYSKYCMPYDYTPRDGLHAPSSSYHRDPADDLVQPKTFSLPIFPS